MIWVWRHARPGPHGRPCRGDLLVRTPSLPMFLLIPWLLRLGWSFWSALAAGCVLTILLYVAMTLIKPKFSLKL